MQRPGNAALAGEQAWATAAPPGAAHGQRPGLRGQGGYVIGPYLNPQARATVFGVEKTAVQAFDRKDLTLPLSRDKPSTTASRTSATAR
jgi:hypothetical protein